VAVTLSVATQAGDIEVTFRVPYEQDSARFRPPNDVLAELHELAQDEEEIDTEARRPLEDELLRQFLASAEGKGLADLQSCNFVMDFAADYFSATIATLSPSELAEIVFEIFPRKLSVEPSVAARIVEENRALYAFLKREFGLRQAEACLRVLGGDAAKKLEAALADPSKFGMAKSLFMKGREAGFDMDSREGVEAWMRLMQSQPLPASFGLPSFGPSRAMNPAAARSKKSQQKTTRKARRKNR
jgi:hypothetical protein